MLCIVYIFDLDNEHPEIKEMMNKISTYNKSVITLMELIGKMSEKLDTILDLNVGVKNDEEKKKELAIFERKKVWVVHLGIATVRGFSV